MTHPARPSAAGLLRRLIGSSALVVALRLGGAAIVVLTQGAIARRWGGAALGDYVLVVAAVNLVACVMPLGFQVVGGYFAAEYRARGDGPVLRVFLGRAYAHVAITLLAIAPAVLLLGRFESAVATILAALWPQFLLITTATAIVYVNGAILVGLGRPAAALMADALFRPLAMAAGFLAVLASEGGAPDVPKLVWIAAVAYGAVAIVHARTTIIVLGELPRGRRRDPVETRRWWRFAPPWVLITLATEFFFDIDLIHLSTMMERESLAVFGICARIFSLAAFVVGAVYTVALPDIVAEADRDRGAFGRRVSNANLVASGAAACMSVGAVVLGPTLLGLFGPAFAAGAAPVAVLCLGLTLRCALGPASLVLSLHDRPYASLPSVAIGLGALWIGNVILVPDHGVMGAAAAAFLSISLWSASLWLTALRQTGIDVSVLPRLRRAAA